MRTWKNYLCMLAALVVTLGFTSCESDEDIGFDLSGLYGVTWFGDMGAGDSWGEPLDSYITFTSGSRPDHGVGTEDLYYTTPPFEYYDTYKFDWFIENGRLYIDYDTGESIIIDYPHVNGNYFYGTIGNFDFRLEYDGGRSVKRQADMAHSLYNSISPLLYILLYARRTRVHKPTESLLSRTGILPNGSHTPDTLSHTFLYAFD